MICFMHTEGEERAGVQNTFQERFSGCYLCAISATGLHSKNVCSSDNIFTLSEKGAICPLPSVTFLNQKVICSSGLAVCGCRHDGKALPGTAAGSGGQWQREGRCCSESQLWMRSPGWAACPLAGTEQRGWEGTAFQQKGRGASPPLWFSALSSLPALGSQLRQGCGQGALGTHPAPHSPPILSPPRSEATPR